MTKSNPNDLLYNIALTMIPNIGSVSAQNLISYCGTAEKVFNASKAKLLSVPLIGEERADFISKADVLKQAEKEIEFIEKHKITPLLYTDEQFPSRLKDCDDSPFLLFYKGNADLNAKMILGIVGTRTNTAYGKEVTQKLVEELAALDILIVSGLAYGIDAAAHHSALENNLKTVAVLGHGLNTISPAQNTSLAKKICDQGGLLTEFTSQSKPNEGNFPQRNRIVAGMCDAILVIESAIKGGALITASIANSYNRDVFAIPGRINDKMSAGCNALIQKQKATMITSGKELVEAMNWDITEGKAKKASKNLVLPLLTAQEKILYDLISANTELAIDAITIASQMNAGTVATTLLEMEMNNIIVTMPGKRYKLKG